MNFSNFKSQLLEVRILRLDQFLFGSESCTISKRCLCSLTLQVYMDIFFMINISFLLITHTPIFFCKSMNHLSYRAAAFLTQSVALDDSTVKFEIWDTAGQERYRSLAPMYYRGAAAAIVVYDITNPDSFAGAQSWVKELQRRGDQNVVIAMVSYPRVMSVCKEIL